LYDGKITRSLQLPFVLANKKSNKVINGVSITDVKAKIKGNFKSTISLIENRKRIKDAVVKSNAETKVKIGSKEYTVAEAIERKSSLGYDREFLSTLKQQFHSATTKVDGENASLSGKLETYLSSVLGDKTSRNSEDVANYTKGFMDNNEYELIDPGNVSEYIKKLEEEIEEFSSQVDYVLSESNSTTFINVDLVD